MKRFLLCAVAILLSVGVWAQRSVKLIHLWEKPTVHVWFEGYLISFRVSDVNKALQLLAESGDSAYAHYEPLDTAGEFHAELYSGLKTEYKNTLQPLLQTVVGPFLLMSGRAEVTNPRRKKLDEVIADVMPVKQDAFVTYINFFDPKNKHLLFSGTMPMALYNKDLGLN